MELKKIIHTLRHLKASQILYQMKDRIHRPGLRMLTSPTVDKSPALVEPISKQKCYDGDEQFTFINISDTFSSWEERRNGNLWAFNLNYMDWLNQEGLSDSEAAEWVDRYIAKMAENPTGNDPYPTALRCMNWIRLFSMHPGLRNNSRDDALYSQCRLLEQRLEYKLLANHLLEELFALFQSAIYFKDEQLYKTATKGLYKELDEQILSDGAHYEQSPMYHCILLDRLLDCYNYGTHNMVFSSQSDFVSKIGQKAVLMLGHLESIVYRDGTIPLMNDAAYHIGPCATDLFAYAKRLGLEWEKIPLGASGYRKLNTSRLELVINAGAITATYQPGHTHADFLSYELRVDGKPFIVDTGTSTYDKGPRRNYERSTRAHNTVSVDGKDSCEVWSGFRVGNRPNVVITKDQPNELAAFHDGYGKQHKHERRLTLTPSSLTIEDSLGGNISGISLIHFSEGTDVTVTDHSTIETPVAIIHIEGATEVHLHRDTYSTEYNIKKNCQVAEVRFCQPLTYSIRLK